MKGGWEVKGGGEGRMGGEGCVMSPNNNQTTPVTCPHYYT